MRTSSLVFPLPLSKMDRIRQSFSRKVLSLSVKARLYYLQIKHVPLALQASGVFLPGARNAETCQSKVYLPWVLSVKGEELNVNEHIPARSQSVSEAHVNLRVGDHVLTATLLDNKTARDFVSILPVTLRMRDLYRREKTGKPPRPLADSGPAQPTFEIGDLAYWAPGPSIVPFYDDINTSLDGTTITVIGKVQSGIDLFSSYDGPVEVTFERNNSI
jgi:hypothetical protein